MFRSFRTRLIVLVVGLVLLTQAGAFLLVNAANIRNAKQQIRNDLELASGVFRRIIDERSFGLISNARLLSGDFAFKQAFATGDHGTLLSAMDNHLQRIQADIMVLIDPQGRLIADTQQPELADVANPWPALLERAEKDDFGEASGIVLVGEQLHQMTVVPLFTPEPSAWILFGFRIDDAFARDLGKISDVSVLRETPDGWLVVASTLPERLQPMLQDAVTAADTQMERSRSVEFDGEPYVTLLTPLADDPGRSVLAVLQRSLERELEPYANLRNYLIVLFASGLTVSLLAAILLARGVTRPVLDLAAGAVRIAAGDYAGRVRVEQRDEIGQLATSFNEMASGLQDRERVRSLLGKVVSPAIAEELLSRNIELGGEEREVSVLFADVRDFTALCEGQSPAAILDLLNRYLTRVSQVVEARGGVVDKYVGDAMMALFGAPLAHPDDPERAVRAALEMREAVAGLNEELRGEGIRAIRLGIGINTASVVAGNMGSASRLNYTVIGDGVNLASRLEGLTKIYGVPLIVSENTRRRTSGLVFRELDRVRVKGKTEAVAIFEPLAADDAIDDSLRRALELHAQSLECYRSRDWSAAATGFARLAAEFPDDKLYALYLARCKDYLESPPPADWDGSFTHEGK